MRAPTLKMKYFRKRGHAREESKRNRIERAVAETIRLLRVLTEGQGFVSIEVFDSGAGGGFSSGKLHADWLRDGVYCDVAEYSEREFIDEIMKMIDTHHEGMAIAEFYRGNGKGEL